MARRVILAEPMNSVHFANQPLLAVVFGRLETAGTTAGVFKTGCIMPKPFKRTYRAVDPTSGRTVARKTKNYYGKFKDGRGIECRVKLTTDKAASQEMLNELVRNAARAQSGILDSFAPHRKTPLVTHLEDFRRHLLADNNTPGHVEKTVTYTRKILEACEFQFVADFNANRVASYLHDRRKPVPVVRVSAKQVAGIVADVLGLAEPPSRRVNRLLKKLPPAEPSRRGFPARWEWSEIRPGIETEFGGNLSRQCPLPDEAGMSIAGSNDYLASIKNFANWLVRSRRIAENPFAHLSKLNAATDPRHERRPAALDEFARLLKATEQAPSFRRLTGQDRAMLYLVAVSTGYRASELASLTRSSFDLESNQPTVTVKAAYSKRRRTDTRPIRSDLANILAGWLQTRFAVDAVESSAIVPLRPTSLAMRDARVWPGDWPKKAAVMLRRDLEAAGIPYRDDDGRVLDFHALRHTFGTNLARAGVAPKVAQELMRHSDINLTMGTYTHVGLYDLNAAVESLPAFALTKTPLAATGTTDARPKPEQPLSSLVQNWHQASEKSCSPTLRAIASREAETPSCTETKNPHFLGGNEGCCESLMAVETKSHRSDLNRRPMLYESIALPTELRWRLVAEAATRGGVIVTEIGDVKANSGLWTAAIHRRFPYSV
jgi:integrase